MNAAYETLAPESSPQASLSSENLAGDAYLKIDFAQFGYVEYKRDDPVDRLPVLGVFEVSWFSVKDNMGRQVQENSLHLTPYEQI